MQQNQALPPRRSVRRGVAAINITPLVDVLLILLVLLLLAMPMYVKRLPVDLPRTELGGTPTPQQVLSVTLLPGDELRVNSVRSNIPDLQRQVGPTVTVELAIDKTVEYDAIAQVVAAVQDKRPKEIVLITR